MPTDTQPAPTTPLPTWPDTPERYPVLRGPKMRLADFDSLAPGVVLVHGYWPPRPVEYLGIEAIDRDRGGYGGTRRQTIKVRHVRVRHLEGPRLAGTTELLRPAELFGPWADYVARCQAEDALRLPTVDARDALAAALTVAGIEHHRTSAALIHPGGDHSGDHVELSLPNDQAQRLAAWLHHHGRIPEGGA